ncbi:hypothetical protein RYX45_22120, partial [Alkalihalophilus pseudofirmus]
MLVGGPGTKAEVREAAAMRTVVGWRKRIFMKGVGVGEEGRRLAVSSWTRSGDQPLEDRDTSSQENHPRQTNVPSQRNCCLDAFQT